MAALLEMQGISKRYPGVIANDAIDFSVERGEVHALLGENGAGKSTLMGILYGLITATSGQICFDGQPVKIRTPRNAIELGIGMVHQHFMLIPALTVVENIVLGNTKGLGLINLKREADRLTELSRMYGLEIDPHARVSQLSVGEQQRVEIVKALYHGANLLILDEPTAVLTPQEADELFSILRKLTDQGHAVIFISHKLNEVMAVSDRVTVLRSGKVVGVTRTAAASVPELARMMVGREVAFSVTRPPREPGRVVLETRGLTVGGGRAAPALRDVSLTVRAGEVLGVAGVDGNGQRELVEAIAGLVHVSGGQVLIDGVDYTNAGPRKVLAANVGHVPGDRNVLGLVAGMSVAENAVLSQCRNAPFAHGPFLDRRAIGDYTRELMRNFQVKAPSEDVPAQSLSGGNQQKLVMARELGRHPALLLAMHPTRGLDVGATEFVHTQILEARSSGCAVLLVSTELDEVLALSDRIAVMYGGAVAGVLDADDADVQTLGLMMAGGR